MTVEKREGRRRWRMRQSPLPVTTVHIMFMVLLFTGSSCFGTVRANVVMDQHQSDKEQLATPPSHVDLQNETLKQQQAQQPLNDHSLDSGGGSGDAALLDDITDLTELSDADRAKLMASAAATVTTQSDQVTMRMVTPSLTQTDNNLVKSESTTTATTTTTPLASTGTMSSVDIEQLATVRSDSDTTSTRRVETTTTSTTQISQTVHQSPSSSETTESLPVTAPPPPTRAHTIKTPGDELNVHYEPNSTDRSPDQVKNVANAESQIGQPPVLLSSSSTPATTTAATTIESTAATRAPSVTHSNNTVASNQESNSTLRQEEATTTTTIKMQQAQITEKPKEAETTTIATTTTTTVTPASTTQETTTTAATTTTTAAATTTVSTTTEAATTTTTASTTLAPTVTEVTTTTTLASSTTSSTTTIGSSSSSSSPEVKQETVEEISKPVVDDSDMTVTPTVSTTTTATTTVADASFTSQDDHNTTKEDKEEAAAAARDDIISQESTSTPDSRAPLDSVPPTTPSTVVVITPLPTDSSTSTIPTHTASSLKEESVEERTTTTAPLEVFESADTAASSVTETEIQREEEKDSSTPTPSLSPKLDTMKIHHSPALSQKIATKLNRFQSVRDHHRHSHEHTDDEKNGEVNELNEKKTEEKLVIAETSTKKPYFKVDTVSESELLNEEIESNTVDEESHHNLENHTQDHVTTIETTTTAASTEHHVMDEAIVHDHHNHDHHEHESTLDIDHIPSNQPQFDFDSEIKWCLNASPARLFLAKYLHAVYSPIVQFLPESIRSLLLDTSICQPIGLNLISLVILGNTIVFFFATWYALIRQVRHKQARVVISLNEQLIVLFNNQKQLEFQNKAYMKLIGDMETRQAYSTNNVRNRSVTNDSRGASVSSEPGDHHYQTTIQQYEARLASLKQAHDSLVKTLHHAQSNEQALATQVASLHEQAEKRREEHERHRTELEFQIGRMNEALQEFNKRVLDDDEKIVAYDQLVREQQVRLESVQKELVDKENTINMLKTNLLGKLSQIVNTSSSGSGSDDSTGDMEVIEKSELLSEENQAESATKLLESLMNLGQLESELKKLQETLTLCQDEKAQKASECVSLASQLSEQVENVQALESRLKRMERTVKENEIQIRLLGELREQDAKQHLRSLSDLDAQLKKKTTESEKVSHLLEQLRLKQERIHELESQTNRVEKQSNVERQTFEKQIHENWLNAKKLDKQLREATSELATLNQKLSDADATNRALQTELSMFKQLGPVHQLQQQPQQLMVTPIRSVKKDQESDNDSRASSAYLVQDSELNDSQLQQQPQLMTSSQNPPRPPSVASNPGHFAPALLSSPSYTYMGHQASSSSPIRYPAFPPPAMMNPMAAAAAYMQSQHAAAVAANPELMHQQQQHFQQMMLSRMPPPYMMSSPPQSGGGGFPTNQQQQMTQSAPSGNYSSSGDQISSPTPPPMSMYQYQPAAQLVKDHSYDSLHSQEGMMMQHRRMSTSLYSDHGGGSGVGGQHHQIGGSELAAHDSGNAGNVKYDETSSTNSNFNV